MNPESLPVRPSGRPRAVWRLTPRMPALARQDLGRRCQRAEDGIDRFPGSVVHFVVCRILYRVRHKNGVLSDGLHPQR